MTAAILAARLVPATVYRESVAEHRLQVRLRLTTCGTDVAVMSGHLRRIGADTTRLDAAYAEMLRALFDVAEKALA